MRTPSEWYTKLQSTTAQKIQITASGEFNYLPWFYRLICLHMTLTFKQCSLKRHSCKKPSWFWIQVFAAFCRQVQRAYCASATEHKPKHTGFAQLLSRHVVALCGSITLLSHAVERMKRVVRPRRCRKYSILVPFWASRIDLKLIFGWCDGTYFLNVLYF